MGVGPLSFRTPLVITDPYVVIPDVIRNPVIECPITFPFGGVALEA